MKATTWLLKKRANGKLLYLPAITWNKRKFYQQRTHWRKFFLQLLLLKNCKLIVFRQINKTCSILWSIWVFFALLEKIKSYKYCLWEINLIFYVQIFRLGSCSIVGKPLCYHASDPGFDSPWRLYHQMSLSPRAVRPTQPSILPRSVNEYRIIPCLTLGHRRWGLLPSTTTGGTTEG